MRCPIDDTDLVMTDRQGIEIDYCPKCRGVWLDRGELDKVIERSSSAGTPPQGRDNDYERPHHYEERRDREYERHDHDRHEYHDDHRQHGKKHKKEGFLGDLFDF